MDSHMIYSTNKKAEKIVGKRDERLSQPGAIILFSPAEQGYHCPVCKYKHSKTNYDERLEWSEYNGFIFCYVCNKDYPSCLCMPDIDKAIDIYLDTVKEAKNMK